MKKTIFILALILGVNGLYCQQIQAEKELLWSMSGVWTSSLGGLTYEFDFVSSPKTVNFFGEKIEIEIIEIDVFKKIIVFTWKFRSCLSENDTIITRLSDENSNLSEKTIKKLVLTEGDSDPQLLSLEKGFNTLFRERQQAKEKQKRNAEEQREQIEKAKMEEKGTEPPSNDIDNDSSPIRISVAERLKKLKHVNVSYPGTTLRLQGVVIIEVIIDIKGRVCSTRIISGHPLLNEAAVSAVKQWVYEPYILNGVPKPVIFTVTVTFSLRNQ